MSEKEKIDINAPIEAKIKAAKGLKLGDDRFNPLEKKLLDDIIVEHGEAIASTREAMNADFSNLLEDVADLSEWNQRQLREVAEMLGVTLKTKDGGLQMNYELFQKILSFQRDNKMKLTGVVDKTLHAALKEKIWKKPAETPEQTTPNEPEKKETPYTGYTPREEPKTREEIIQSIAEKPYINSDSAYPVGIQESAIVEPISTPAKTTETETADYERIPPPPIPSTPTGIASSWVQASVNAAPSVAAQPTSTPSAIAGEQWTTNEPTGEEVGEYGKKVGIDERKDIVENAENAADILSQTTSVDVLKTKWSTKSVIKILDKYLQAHPEKREEMIQALRTQIWDFSRPLQTPEEVGAFQQLFYLAYPERFADEMKYIDGEYGDKTKETFMRDAYTLNWSAILTKITDAASVTNLTPFEREVLQKNLSRDTASVGAGSSAEEIRKAQILLALNGELGDMAIDGTWSPELDKLINRLPPISSTESYDDEDEKVAAEKVAKARAILSESFQITSSTMANDDGMSRAKNRTGLIGIKECTVAWAMNLAEAMGNPDGLRITGGTENGHTWLSFWSNVYTHSNGYKLDFWVHPALVEFTGLTGKWQKVTMDIKWQKVLFYRHGPNDHFDVTFYPTN